MEYATFSETAPARKPTSYIAPTMRMIFHFNLTMQGIWMMTTQHFLGANIRRNTTPKTYVVQRILSAQVDNSDKLRCHNLFQMFLIIKDCHVCTIIDGGSCNNLVSEDFVTKIGLSTHPHTHPYYIRWLNNSGKTKVPHTTRVHFFISTYHDYVDCDVVPMQVCSLLLGHPWKFDIDVVHHGISNKYTLVHR
jgi:hypothetical protein